MAVDDHEKRTKLPEADKTVDGITISKALVSKKLVLTRDSNSGRIRSPVILGPSLARPQVHRELNTELFGGSI